MLSMLTINVGVGFDYYFFKFIFIYLAASGLSCGTQDLHCSMQDCSLRCVDSSLWHTGSVVAARRHSCPVAFGILVPRPGIKPVPPALEGGFLTTGPPGKSLDYYY